MAKVIGLTGGIASGKSTVTAFLRKKGYQVIDADAVVHQLQQQGGLLYQALVDWLGPEIVRPDGQLDRPVLSQLIFSSPENRAKSAQLQNDIIRQELSRLRDELAEKERVFFMDIPLLIELDYQGWFDQIWLVYVDETQQKQRLMARNGYSSTEADQRLASQMPLADKKKFADVILDNSGSIENLENQLEDALKELGKSRLQHR